MRDGREQEEEEEGGEREGGQMSATGKESKRWSVADEEGGSSGSTFTAHLPRSATG